MKRELVEFKRAVVPLQRPLVALTSSTYRAVPKEIRRYFRDVQDHLQRVAEQANGYDDLLNSILQARLAQVTVEQNNDMRKIASWAAIAAVQTFIAGIYGMNFRVMPETQWEYGYPALLAVMFSLVYVMYRGFRRSGSGSGQFCLWPGSVGRATVAPAHTGQAARRPSLPTSASTPAQIPTPARPCRAFRTALPPPCARAGRRRHALPVPRRADLGLIAFHIGQIVEISPRSARGGRWRRGGVAAWRRGGRVGPAARAWVGGQVSVSCPVGRPGSGQLADSCPTGGSCHHGPAGARDRTQAEASPGQGQDPRKSP